VRRLAKLLLISLPTLLLALVVLEFVVLRFWVAIDDVPIEQCDGSNQILRYVPNQTGRSYPDRDLRHPVPFAINADGWNSVHPRYDVPRNGKLRLAVVGDSYVAALEVAPQQSLAGRLESDLGKDDAEVYAFGVRGAPLSQYLQIARYVVATYAPDAVVVVIVHNDFDESYRLVGGRYTRSFLHLNIDAAPIEEVPPVAYEEPSLEAWVRTRSYAFRFFFYRLQVGSQELRRLYASLVGAPKEYQANVETGGLAGEEKRIRKVAGYVFDQFARLERSSGTRFLLVMDAPRQAIYDEQDPRKTAVYGLNRVAAGAAAEARLPFIDLTGPFERDYRQHGARFEFLHDGHWNARGHELAAREICRALQSDLEHRRILCGGEAGG
jgi:SGNH hydrolase-like domain, acetyltransferase AlgX